MDIKEIAACVVAGRVVSLRGKVDNAMVDSLYKQAHVFKQAANELVIVVLTTSGGNIEDGLIIYNILRTLVQSGNVRLVASVTVQSVGLNLMMAVPKDCRLAYPHTTFYGHHPRMGYKVECRGGARDHEYAIAEYQAALEQHPAEQQRLAVMVAEGTGMKVEDVIALYDKPRFLDTAEAQRLGFVSGILT